MIWILQLGGSLLFAWTVIGGLGMFIERMVRRSKRP